MGPQCMSPPHSAGPTRSQHTPSESAAPYARPRLSHAVDREAALHAIAERIHAMERERDAHLRAAAELDAALGAARKEHARAQNALRPVSALPTELVCAIFEMGVRAQHPERRARPFEVLVSHVAQRWRAAALGCPRLWTRVAMSTRAVHARRLAALYVKRSGALPLDVEIRSYALDWDEDSFEFEREFGAMCATVFPHAARWRRLHCEFDSYPEMDEFLGRLPSSAPILQHLDIRYHHNNWARTRIPDTDAPLSRKVFCDGAPSLRSVHFLGITLANCLPPLNGLTSLQYHTPLYTISPATMQRDFASLTALTHLVLSATNFTGWEATAALALPALVSLHLRLIWDYDKVLGALAAPRLEALYLGWVDGLELDRLSSTLLRPAPALKFPRLRRLTVRSLQAQGNIRVPMWKALMAALPGVTHFAFLNKDIKNFLLALGDVSPGTAALLGRPWPALEVLALPNMLSAFEVRLMLAVQERRLAGCAVGAVLLPRSLAASAKLAKALAGVCGVREYDRATDMGYEVEWRDNDDAEADAAEEEVDDGDLNVI
ncbi:hypothetical protein HWV62_15869 [Athelia sp. TMB]|nr:hypothetical protein HWV62_15869 [Athelia sp. TMB]